MHASCNFANPLFPCNPQIVTGDNFLLIFNDVQDRRLYGLLGITHVPPALQEFVFIFTKGSLNITFVKMP